MDCIRVVKEYYADGTCEYFVYLGNKTLYGECTWVDTVYPNNLVTTCFLACNIDFSPYTICKALVVDEIIKWSGVK